MIRDLLLLLIGVIALFSPAICTHLFIVKKKNRKIIIMVCGISLIIIIGISLITYIENLDIFPVILFIAIVGSLIIGDTLCDII